MKLVAKVNITGQKGETYGEQTVKVDVDADYVTPYESDIREYVANELAEIFGCSFGDDEFEITNLEDLIEDMKFDEFEHKTQYANM